MLLGILLPLFFLHYFCLCFFFLLPCQHVMLYVVSFFYTCLLPLQDFVLIINCFFWRNPLWNSASLGPSQQKHDMIMTGRLTQSGNVSIKTRSCHSPCSNSYLDICFVSLTAKPDLIIHLLIIQIPACYKFVIKKTKSMLY